jgi:hypothetical protein
MARAPVSKTIYDRTASLFLVSHAPILFGFPASRRLSRHALYDLILGRWVAIWVAIAPAP